MDWNEKLQIIIDYVESHLQQKEKNIDTDEIAKIAGCSYTFYQKVFSYMNGFSFAEYVRFRKMTLAGYDLKSSDIKVVELSYKYGYDSPTSFTKAFQQFHGFSPREARQKDRVLRVYPRMQITGQQEYSWKTEHKPAFRLIGKSTEVSCKQGNHAKIIPAFWNQCQQSGVYSALISMDTGCPKGLYGLFGGYHKITDTLTYNLAVCSDKKLPDGYCEIKIPETNWVIVNCTGPVPGAIQRGWKYLKEEWMVKYPFTHARCPDIEWYSDGNAYGEDFLSQIWIPIVEE